MVRSAAYLFRERGYSGTGFRDVIAHSGAPRGSIYHHFPEGKAQLAEEAVRYAGDFLNAGITAAVSGDDATAAIDVFGGWWRRVLVKSDFRAGCPVVAVTVESHDDAPRLTAAAAAAFARWEDTLATALANSGVPDERAGRLATLIVSAVEGATILCRARRDAQPLDDVIVELKALTRAAVLPE
ncbi:TetR/AcrR family transcriptional regulator [Actinomadura craniellae]|uniref:TetR/AcrR family transcriptional regulator n=2 Tax=Actinomadura craniellae TaxID=2231787 RepID=A0A365H440_9ACTN|nr:TetR/AcrR family transcriptional regulator [Actinomadura craniellae]